MTSKQTTGKPKMRYLPHKAKEQIAYVRQFGCEKYQDKVGDSYKDVAIDDFLDAAERHIGKYRSGEIYDNESGLNHLAHAATSLLLALDNEDPDVLPNLSKAKEAIEMYTSDDNLQNDLELDEIHAVLLGLDDVKRGRIYTYKSVEDFFCEVDPETDECREYLAAKAKEIWENNGGDVCVS